MIVVWRGWGILTIPLVGAVIIWGLLGTLWVTETLLLPNWTKPLGFAIAIVGAGAINWIVGRYLNKKGRPRIIHDEKTGRPLTKVGQQHDLFFIKMEYWSVPLFLIAVVFIASAFYAK